MHLQSIAAIIVSLATATMTSSVPLNNRIVHGTPVQVGELPSFAQVLGCGGILIGPQTVLTVAHCADHPVVNSNVYLGSVKEGKGKHLKIAKAVMHPEYNSPGSTNDIAVVFLPEKVEGPYALIEGTSYPEGGSKLTVAGHGSTSFNGTGSPDLLKVQVTIGNTTQCAAHKNINGRIFDPKAQVCATDNGYSACHSDSGGPLYYGSGKDVHVVGLVSGAGNVDRCGEKGTYQYFTFIKPFIPWIKSEIEKFERSGANSTSEPDANMKSAMIL
ncbi:hypothetical protein BGZ72_001184 [Mortierella alpina]|nr:hypothetical protein BGZ72_001184 [Mortierella alpina]